MIKLLLFNIYIKFFLNRITLSFLFKKFNNEQTELVKIDPNRFWKSKGTISKIAAILGAAGGAYISGRYGGPNTWNEMIDKEITRDIESQKLDRDHAVKKKLDEKKKDLGLFLFIVLDPIIFPEWQQ